eukprot:1160023-Pelagomonas_calceolata.AAC.1
MPCCPWCWSTASSAAPCSTCCQTRRGPRSPCCLENGGGHSGQGDKGSEWGRVGWAMRAALERNSPWAIPTWLGRLQDLRMQQTRKDAIMGTNALPWNAVTTWAARKDVIMGTGTVDHSAADHRA